MRPQTRKSFLKLGFDCGYGSGHDFDHGYDLYSDLDGARLFGLEIVDGRRHSGLPLLDVRNYLDVTCASWARTYHANLNAHRRVILDGW